MRILTRFIIIFLCLICLEAKADWNPSSDSIQIVRENLKRGNPDNAIAYLPRVINSMETNPDQFIDSAFVYLSVTLSTAYQMKGDMFSSNNVMENALTTLSKKGINKIFPEFEFAYGLRQYLLGNYKTAINHIKKCLEVSENEYKTSDYLSVQSALISCYIADNDSVNTINTISYATTLIDTYADCYSSLSKVQVLSNSGVYYVERGNVSKGISLIEKAYSLAKEDNSCEGFWNRIVMNLGTYYLNIENYDKALSYFQQVHQELLNSREKEELYNILYDLYYYIGDEINTSKYVLLNSNSIKDKIRSYFSHFSYLTLDNLWDKGCTQLKVNMGVLHKFKNNQRINEMCYDNALFAKTLIYNIKDYERKYISTHTDQAKQYNKIKDIRSQMFLMESNDSNVTRLKNELIDLEEQIKNNLGISKDTIVSYNWRDIKKTLKNNECAIEIISSVGYFNSHENPSLKLGALLLFKNSVYPQYISLCENNDMQETIRNAIANQEIGINELYSFGNKHYLYDLLWKNIEPLLKDGCTIYISPTLTTQFINWGFIPCPDGRYLNEKYNIKTVSSTAILARESIQKINDACIFGDINYDNKETECAKSKYRGLIMDYEATRGNFSQLIYTKEEIDSVSSILKRSSIKTNVETGESANERSFKQLDGDSPSIIHISSHAYYLVGFDKFDNYFKKLTPYIARDESMIKSGILFSGANSSLNSNNEITQDDGVITAEEISAMDLSKTDLVVLSACESLIGNSNDGLGGLPKAFKLAGAHSIVGSLWQVSDNITSKLMIEFYHNLSIGIDKDLALKKAQYKIKEMYPDPFYWAAFIIID